MTRLDQGQLIAGGLRTLMWVIGAFVAIGYRRLLPALGLGLASCTSGIFGWFNAGGYVSPDLFHGVAYASVITPGLLVAALILACRSPSIGRGWRL